MTATRRRTNLSPWADQWKRALTEAADDPNRLGAGAKLARDGAVGQISTAPLTVTAQVVGINGTSHRATISTTTLSEAQWDAVTSAIAAHPEHRAAVLSGHLHRQLADPAHIAGIRLVPAATEITFRCTCRNTPTVCQHSAALGHALTPRIAANPSVFLVLRGLSMSRLTTRLTAAVILPEQRTTARAGEPRPATLPTEVRADHAYQLWRTHTQPLPQPGTYPTAGGHPVLDQLRDEPPAPAPPLEHLRLLTASAAHHATALLNGQTNTATGVDALGDAIRLLATTTGLPYLEDAATHLGRTPEELRLLLAAYRLGGIPAVHAAAASGPADPDVVAAAEQRIQPLRPGAPGPLTCDRNRITDMGAGLQVRLGPDGRWYPFAASGGDWRPAAGHSADPAAAFTAARRARLARPGGS
ncbi:hypothetical protein OG689_41875 [Kitasatospora sp. NBC_00240]|uniref:SWIM zinc finger family protein n=1 Tax=Kitasatospora sp. NBC_00240 TaxID=2903567 RepID=UPI0022512030|nr:hypothetical protein [Kitasatospora sp. NBC_00240]MCX5215708.1 hypothetical protein [Kitasatospora sp. NBC_00240]